MIDREIPDLYPCPFCGDSSRVNIDTEYNIMEGFLTEATGNEYIMEDYSDAIEENLYGYRVVCSKCVITGPWAPLKAGAIKAWNGRLHSMKTIVYRDTGKEELVFLDAVKKEKDEV